MNHPFLKLLLLIYSRGKHKIRHLRFLYNLCRRFLSILKESFTKRTSSSLVKSSESIEMPFATRGQSSMTEFQTSEKNISITHLSTKARSSLAIFLSICQPVVAEFLSLSLSRPCYRSQAEHQKNVTVIQFSFQINYAGRERKKLGFGNKQDR